MSLTRLLGVRGPEPPDFDSSSSAPTVPSPSDDGRSYLAKLASMSPAATPQVTDEAPSYLQKLASLGHIARMMSPQAAPPETSTAPAASTPNTAQQNFSGVSSLMKTRTVFDYGSKLTTPAAQQVWQSMSQKDRDQVNRIYQESTAQGGPGLRFANEGGPLGAAGQAPSYDTEVNQYFPPEPEPPNWVQGVGFVNAAPPSPRTLTPEEMVRVLPIAAAQTAGQISPTELPGEAIRAIPSTGNPYVDQGVQGVAGVFPYLIPGVGQAKIATDVAQTGINVAADNISPAEGAIQAGSLALFPVAGKIGSRLLRMGASGLVGVGAAEASSFTQGEEPTWAQRTGAFIGGTAGGAFGGNEHRLPGKRYNLTPVQQAFVDQVTPYAERASKATRIPTDVIVGQWAHESNFGVSRVAGRTGNLAGIKTRAAAASGAEHYQEFGDMNSFTDEYIDTINHSRYDDVRDIARRGGTAQEIGDALHKAGYAEDSEYGTKIATRVGQVNGTRPASTVPAVEPAEPLTADAPPVDLGAEALKQEVDLGQHAAYQPGAYITDAPIVEHEIQNGLNAGSARRGVIAEDLTMEQARAIDPYAHAKDDGIFIGERHVSRPDGYEEVVPVQASPEIQPVETQEIIPKEISDATITGQEEYRPEHPDRTGGRQAAETIDRDRAVGSGRVEENQAPAPRQEEVRPEAPPEIQTKPSDAEVEAQFGPRPEEPSRYEEIRQAARSRLLSRGNELRSSILPFDPRDVADWTLIGASHIAEGAHDFALWSAKMAAEVGEHVKTKYNEDVKPWLAEIMHASARRYEQEFGELPVGVKLPERPEDGPIGIKHALNMAERERFGLPAIERSEPYTDKQANEDAQLIHSANPERVRALLASFEKSVPTLSKLESNIVEIEYAKRAKAVDAATDAVNDAKTPEERELAMKARREADHAFDTVSDIVVRSGKEAGRSLQARKAMIDRDRYTLSKMRNDLRAELGRDLTDREESTLHGRAEKMAEAQGKIDAEDDKMSLAAATDKLTQSVKKKKGESTSVRDVNESIKQRGEPTSSLIDQLVRAYARAGVPKEQILSKVHGDLVALFPGMTERQMRDIYSGYGKPKYPNPANDAKIASELRSESQSLSALEDAQQGIVPKRSGLQRRKPSDLKRALVRQVRDLMRELGLDAESRADRLKGALDQAKSRMRNAISDAEQRIGDVERAKQEGRKLPPVEQKRRAVEYDEEANKLREHLDALKEHLYELENGPRPTEEQVAKQRALEAVETSMAEYERRIAAQEFVVRKKDPSLVDSDPEVLELRAGRDLVRKEYEAQKREYEESLRPPRDEDAERLRVAKSAMQRSVDYWNDRIDLGQKQGRWDANQKTPVAPDAELGALKSARDDAKARFELFHAFADPEFADRILKERYQKSLAKQIEGYKNRIDRARKTSELETPREQRDWYKERDENIRKAMAERDRLRMEHDNEITQIRRANRTLGEKILDAFLDLRRASVISGPEAFVKIANMALVRSMLTPIYAAEGNIMRAIAPKFAAMSPRYGAHVSMSDLGAYYEALFGKGMQEAWQNFKGNPTDLEISNKKESTRAPEVAGVLGFRHAAFKAPVKRAQYELTTRILSRHYASQGMDVTSGTIETNPVKALIHVEANEAAMQEAFLQKNILSKAQSMLTTFIEKTASTPTRGKLQSLPVKAIMPIVRIPTNIAIETGRMVAGVPWVGAKLGVRALLRVAGRPIEELTPKERDVIGRQLQHGALGAALFVYGILNPNAIGGFFRKDRKDWEAEPDEFDLLGVKVKGILGKVLSHAPPFIAMGMGATLRQVYEEAHERGDGATKALAEAMAESAFGLLQHLPLFGAMSEISNVVQGGKGWVQYADNMAKDFLEPQALQSAAKYADSEWRQGHARKPRNLGETLASGIPVLRDQVPFNRGAIKAEITRDFKEKRDGDALKLRDKFNVDALKHNEKPITDDEMVSVVSKTIQTSPIIGSMTLEQAVQAFRVINAPTKEDKELLTQKFNNRMKDVRSVVGATELLQKQADELNIPAFVKPSKRTTVSTHDNPRAAVESKLAKKLAGKHPKRASEDAVYPTP